MTPPRPAATPPTAPVRAGGAPSLTPASASTSAPAPRDPLDGLPHRVEVVVEVSRGSFLKRNGAGRVEYASPIPCPFNYGSVPGTLAPDGDALDALVLGPALPRGARLEADVHGVVRFLDHGETDDKLVCALFVPGPGDRDAVDRFFRFYTWVKRGVNLARAKSGRTSYDGAEWRAPKA